MEDSEAPAQAMHSSDTEVILKEIKSMRNEMKMEIKKLSSLVNMVLNGLSESILMQDDFHDSENYSYSGEEPSSDAENQIYLLESDAVEEKILPDWQKNEAAGDTDDTKSFDHVQESDKESNEMPVACTVVHVDITDESMLEKLGTGELTADIIQDFLCNSNHNASEREEMDQQELEYENGRIVEGDEDIIMTPKEVALGQKYRQVATKKIPILWTSDGRYKCAVCPRTYTAQGNLLRHHQLHTGEKRFVCALCQEKFYRKEYLLRHMHKHSKQYKSVKRARAELDVTDDIKQEVDGKPTNNSYRDAQPVSRSTRYLKGGVVKADDEPKQPKKKQEKYECKVCNNVYMSKSNLHRHQRAHKGDLRYQCDVCLKKFLRSEYLINHMKKHTNRGPRKRRTTKPRKLGLYEKEIVNEDGKKKYQCTNCQKIFATYPNLKRHVRLHTGETPYACKVCKMEFYREDFLLKHARQAH